MKLRSAPKITISLLSIFYLVGLVGLSIPASREYVASLTPLTLLLSAGILFWYHGKLMISEIIIFLLIAVLGYLLELIGVNTGLLFGHYEYGPNLGIKAFNTPFLIGINWLMLIYGAHTIVQKLPVKAAFRILIGALLLVIFDFVLEPAAIYLELWSWEGGHIPIKNYLTWFGVSLLLLTLFHWGKIKLENEIAASVIAIQFIFFTLLILLDNFLSLIN